MVKTLLCLRQRRLFAVDKSTTETRRIFNVFDADADADADVDVDVKLNDV